MTSFFAFAALMIAGSLAWLLRPLRSAGRGGAQSRHRPTNVVLIVVVPLMAAALYAWLGRLDALDPPPPDPVRAMAEQRTAQLAARLETQADDVTGLRLLARSYEQLRRFPDAAKVYSRLVALHPDDADALADLADALSNTQGGSYVGEPIALVRKALSIDEVNARALAIAANEAAQRDDLPAALAYWERLRLQVPADSIVARSLDVDIADAREAMSAKKAKEDGARSSPDRM